MDNGKKRPGRKLGAERRRIARSCLRKYLLTHSEELPRGVVVSMAVLMGCTRGDNRDPELRRHIYG